MVFLRTTSIPVTDTMRDVWPGEDGCASRVVTLCTTFWKGSPCIWASGSPRRRLRCIHTTSFSVIAAPPMICEPSKVSIDCGRWRQRGSGAVAYVERRELRAVRVERRVIEVGELRVSTRHLARTHLLGDLLHGWKVDDRQRRARRHTSTWYFSRPRDTTTASVEERQAAVSTADLHSLVWMTARKHRRMPRGFTSFRSAVPKERAN